MSSPLLDHPSPDFAELERVLKGTQEPQRVHLVELLIDEEVLQAITERYLGQPWIASRAAPGKIYSKQLVTLFHRLGYDYVPVPSWPIHWLNHPSPGWEEVADTAALSRGERAWAREGCGLVTCWEEFERFPWEEIRPDLSAYETVASILPEGMKIVVQTNFLEHIMETILGFEGLFYLLYDDPELVQQVFARWGQKVYDFYECVLSMEEVGAVFHADDMGFKTSTLLSPATLREYVFPWLKKYAALTHERGLMFWLHTCGNHYKAGTMEDLIEDVGIDAFHSFEDVILPVIDFKALYGGRVATLGGVDVDRLVRLDQASLRQYVRNILEQCMEGGRFALGSGNSVTNYIPVENYSVMLEESRRW